jgi:peptidoglycan/LPS O-acetylase OafA/YrhL
MNTSTSAQVGATPHKNNFNFLRLFFASLVLLSHAPEIADGNRSRELLTQFFGSISFGELAVDGFFLLSGYLIVKSWMNEPRILPYLQKRIVRIYPGFIVASIVGALIVGPLGAIPSEYFAQFKAWAFVKGTLLLQSTITPPVFAGQSNPAVNSSMWTIFFEFQCYLLVMVLGVLGAVKRRKIWLTLSIGIVLAFGLHKFGYLALDGNRFIDIARNLVRLASPFFAGGCFYLFKDQIKFTPKLGLIAFAALFAGLFWAEAAEIFLAVFGGYLLFYLGHAHIPALQKFNQIPDISYGLYLYGWPVQKLLFWYWPGLSPWAVFPLSLAASASLGFLSWHLVEKPFLRLKDFRIEGGRLVNSATRPTP